MPFVRAGKPSAARRWLVPAVARASARSRSFPDGSEDVIPDTYGIAPGRLGFGVADLGRNLGREDAQERPGSFRAVREAGGGDMACVSQTR